LNFPRTVVSITPNDITRIHASDTVAGDVRVGAYRIVHELGQGGMGTVFLAVRDDDVFHKRVALKILKRGMDTDSIIRRFRTSGRSWQGWIIRTSRACSMAGPRLTAARIS
jgi:serine/threonine protein kinase